MNCTGSTFSSMNRTLLSHSDKPVTDCIAKAGHSRGWSDWGWAFLRIFLEISSHGGVGVYTYVTPLVFPYRSERTPSNLE
jgi:hypothetical protein